MSYATVTAIRATYPTPLGTQHRAFLEAVARAHSLGLVRKLSGFNVDGVSGDVLMNREGTFAVDILRNADAQPGEPAQVATWSVLPLNKTPSRDNYVPVGDDPVPPPPPPVAQLDRIEQKVDRLIAGLQSYFR